MEVTWLKHAARRDKARIMHRPFGAQLAYAAFFWPALAAASAGEIAQSMTAQFLGFDDPADESAEQEPEGITPNKIALDLHTVRLRDFSVAKKGVPTLLCFVQACALGSRMTRAVRRTPRFS